MSTEDQQRWIEQRAIVIGQRIREARTHANLRQEALAEHLGVERRTVQRIERGETDARLSWLLLISLAVDVPLGDLLATDNDT